MKEEWLMPGAVVPVDVETTAALVAEIKRLIGVVGDMALAEQPTYKWTDETEKVLDQVWVTPKLRPLAKLAHEQELDSYNRKLRQQLEQEWSDLRKLQEAEKSTQHKPWVALTEKEKRDARNSVSYSPLAMTMGEWTEAVQNATEAKLREKNAQPSKPLADEMEKQKNRHLGPHRQSAFRDGWRSAESAHGIKGDA